MQLKSINPILMVSILFLCCSQNPSGVSEPAYDLPKSTLNSEGIDTAKFNEALHYIEDTVKGIQSLVIIRNGKLVFEKYYHFYHTDTTYLMQSTTKSIMSILTGIAIEDSLIKNGLKAKVLDFFPEIQFENLSDNKKNMTIEDLLTMRAGLQWDDNNDDIFDNPDPVKFILDKPMDTTPGSVWNYNSGAPHILSTIINKVSGKPTLEFAKENLFNPLGITVNNWEVDCKGIVFGGYGLYLKPKDLAKIGLLYLNKGICNGTRILNEDWIRSSTDSITSTYWPQNGNYGYLWWINDFGGYASRGLFGQAVYVIPDKNLVVAFTSALNASSADMTLNIIVKDHILPSLH